jgi:hypothetical protein
MPEVSEVSEVLNDLGRRLARLEAAASKQRSYNSRAAAEYLGRSEEWLRLQRLAGKGPRYRKRGRFYDYDRVDLDDYREAGDP